MESKTSEEIVLKVKPGTKVKIVESKKDDPEMKDRDVMVNGPQSMKLSITKASNVAGAAHSTITMCG